MKPARSRWLEPLLMLLLMGTALAGFSAPGAADGAGRSGTRSSTHSSRHGSITEGVDCSACHTPAGWKSLAQGQAGGGFDHSRTGFPLTGRHRAQACVDCHNAAQKITRACNGCHQEPHERRLGQACDSCHSAEGWQRTSAIDQHRFTRLPLTGMHALAECSDCHVRAAGPQWGAVPADCFSCHADDYRRGDVHPSHVGVPGDPARPPFPRDCSFCHRPTGWSPALFAASTVGQALQRLSLSAPPNHDLLFPISSGPHRAARCADCHRSQALARDVRCTGCHAHAPAALRATHSRLAGAVNGQACMSCHPGGSAR